MLLGRVRRPSIGSLQALEMERASPKLIKADPLSVYETTLMKLKEGSQRCQSLPPADSMSTDVSCITASDFSETTGAGSSSANSSIGGESTCLSSPNERRTKTPSVLYLFSKYKSSRNGPSSPDEEAMLIETACSSVSTSPSISNSHFMSRPRGKSLKECFDSEMIRHLETGSSQQREN